MTTLGPLRTALFVPGNRPDPVDKAVNSGADPVIIDLEDAVALPEKEKTRLKVREKVFEHPDRRILVRVNGLNTPFFQGDLKEVIVGDPAGNMVPKVERVEDIHERIHQCRNPHEQVCRNHQVRSVRARLPGQYL